jgi:hypothetical protein
MSVLRSTQRGDMYVHAVIETPMNLTKRQQELLKEFDREGEKAKTSPESEGLLQPGEGVLRGFKGVGRSRQLSAVSYQLQSPSPLAGEGLIVGAALVAARAGLNPAPTNIR